VGAYFEAWTRIYAGWCPISIRKWKIARQGGENRAREGEVRRAGFQSATAPRWLPRWDTDRHGSDRITTDQRGWRETKRGWGT
jgi:hypothetical protein